MINLTRNYPEEYDRLRAMGCPRCSAPMKQLSMQPGSHLESHKCTGCGFVEIRNVPFKPEIKCECGSALSTSDEMNSGNCERCLGDF